MIRLAGLGHVLLRVLDLERSKKFYAEVLGFHILEEDPEHGGTFMALPGQSHAIDLFAVKDPAAAARQTPGVRGLGHIAFRVDSEAALKDAYAALREHGVAITRTIDHVNRGACELLGRERGELIGQPADRLLHPSEPTTLAAVRARRAM